MTSAFVGVLVAQHPLVDSKYQRRLFSPANLDHGGRGGTPAAVQLSFRGLRAFWKAKDPLHQMVKATPGRQVIVVVCFSTS